MMASTFAPDLFAGKCVLVAGGTSGIGAGIAAAFAQCGAMVTVTGATASEVATACAAPDTAPNAFVLDVRDAQAVTARALGHARGRRGRGTVSMLTGRTIHDRRSLAGGRRLSRELIADTTP